VTRLAAISVIVPTYNGARFLAATLASVRAQTRTDWEMVIVDDGSSDTTPEIASEAARKDERIRVVRQENRGIAGARNRGWAESEARTPFVLFLDQDDLLEPDALERLAAAAGGDTAGVGAHGLITVMDADGGRPAEADEFERMARQRPIPLPNGALGALEVDVPTTLGSVAVYNPLRTTGVALVKRAAMEAAGRFDAATEPADDWDLWMRITRIGHLTFVNEVTLRYRLHGANTSLVQSRRMIKAERRVRRKAFTGPEYTSAQRIALLRGYQAWYRSEARAKWTYARSCLRGHDLRGAAVETIRAARCAYSAAIGPL
jgi:glycosyltransferase involved in cell wall biosynthesis